jgi:Na+/glutamate symporter
MKHGHTIITLFAFVSLGALTLWAIHDLWVVVIAILALVGAFSMMTAKNNP